ncbi:unnamed protein product [Effrenium voratum]|nr:unnamed protein product [Effrenium voratum]
MAHHKSHQHQEALAKLGLGEFEQDLETGVAGVGGRKKITQMQYCLGRALFTLDQEFLRNAQVIAISEDVRQHKVLIRYAACDSNLQIRSGLLGYFELGTHSGNIGLRKAMKVALEVFCLDFDGEVDRGLLEHIADKVELFTADAASDEQLAGRLLSSQGLFANLRFVTKDRAHASTRLLERPWQADSELSRIVDQLALGRSVVRRIHNSPHLSTIFAQYCQQMNDAPLRGARIKNLSVAKQRFASISKPVGRRVLYLEALLNTIVWILVNRGPSTDEGKLAIEFLEVMGEEQLVLAGMISDLSDECMRLVRYFDGDYDLAGTCVQLKCFMVRIHFLVNQGRIFDTVGYTQRCIHQLQNDGVQCSVGDSISRLAQLFEVMPTFPSMVNCRGAVAESSINTGTCTTKIERLFSKIAKHIAPDRGCLDEMNELCEAQGAETRVKILADGGVAVGESPLLMQLAQCHWALNFGVPRAAPSHDRLDKGVPRKRKADTEADLKRRKAVAEDHDVSFEDIMAQAEDAAAQILASEAQLRKEMNMQTSRRYYNKALAFLEAFGFA